MQNSKIEQTTERWSDHHGRDNQDFVFKSVSIFNSLEQSNNFLSVREKGTDIVNLLWTFRSVQQRMILRDAQLIRSSAGNNFNIITGGKIPKLKCLSRDAVMLTLTTNNTQERHVAPLVNRLEGQITPQVREQLLSSYTGMI